MKSKEQMAGLDDDSTEIFNSSIIERYSDRPDRNFTNGIYPGVENLCLAEFAAFYYKQYQTEDNLLGFDYNYSTELEEPSVKFIVQRSQSAFEPFSEQVDEQLKIC